jgi:hypothetical protein
MTDPAADLVYIDGFGPYPAVLLGQAHTWITYLSRELRRID